MKSKKLMFARKMDGGILKNVLEESLRVHQAISSFACRIYLPKAARARVCMQVCVRVWVLVFNKYRAPT